VRGEGKAGSQPWAGGGKRKSALETSDGGKRKSLGEETRVENGEMLPDSGGKKRTLGLTTKKSKGRSRFVCHVGGRREARADSREREEKKGASADLDIKEGERVEIVIVLRGASVLDKKEEGRKHHFH